MRTIEATEALLRAQLEKALTIAYPNDHDNGSYQCFGKTYPAFVASMAESDLSGIGVTVSFLLTALGTFIFVLYGFSRNLILDRLTHRTDQLVFSWLPGRRNLSKGEAREREKRDFQTAIQSLGDQQIVIGAAYLVAGISHPCTITLYGLKNLVAVTWLSAIVHCSTMVVAGRNTSSSMKARIFRLVITLTMFGLMFLLNIFYLIISLTSERGNISEHLWNSISIIYLVKHFLRYIFIIRSVQVFVGLLLLLYLSYFYISRILRSARQGKDSEPEPFMEVVAARLFHSRATRYKLQLTKGFRYPVYRQLREHHDWLQLQAKVQHNVRNASSSYVLWWYAITGFYALSSESSLPREASGSLVEEIFWLGFLLSQGFTRFVISWLSFGELRDDNELLRWGVGQIVPVVMLIAPLLTWVSLPSSRSERNGVDEAPDKVAASCSNTDISTSDVEAGTPSTNPDLLKPNLFSPSALRTILLSKSYTPAEFFSLPTSTFFFKLRLFGRLVLAAGVCAAQIIEETGNTAIHQLFYLGLFSLSLLYLLGVFVAIVKRVCSRDKAILKKKRMEARKARARTFESTRELVRFSSKGLHQVDYETVLEHVKSKRRLQARNELEEARESLYVRKGQVATEEKEVERLETAEEDQMAAEMAFLGGVEGSAGWGLLLDNAGPRGLPTAVTIRSDSYLGEYKREKGAEVSG